MKQNKYNYRSVTTGRFIPKSIPDKVVNGRLYDYRGVTVRARKLCRNGKRLVSVHKDLFGFVNDEALTKIDTNTVKNYLKMA